MDSLKKATQNIKDYSRKMMELRDRQLIAKKAALGDTLPDIASWEEYIHDKEVLNDFARNLKSLEEATDNDMQVLATNPGKLSKSWTNILINFNH